MEAGGASLPSRPRLRRSPHAVFRPRPFPGAVPQWSGDVVRGPRLRWVRSRPTAQPTPHPPPARRCGVPAAGTSSPGAELRARRLLCVAAPVPGRSAGDGGEEKAVPPPRLLPPSESPHGPIGSWAQCGLRPPQPSARFGGVDLIRNNQRTVTASEHQNAQHRRFRASRRARPTPPRGGPEPHGAAGRGAAENGFPTPCPAAGGVGSAPLGSARGGGGG